MKRIFTLIIGTLLFTNALAQSSYVECEDTCSHVHGIDLSHYQGTVFWETVGKSKMAFVYLKATEGGDHIDTRYKQNIDLAHQYGLKVGSYHFYRPKTPQQIQLDNFMAQCRPEDQDLIPMIDVETNSRLSIDAFRDSLFKFLDLVEKAYKQKPLIYTGANFYDKFLLGSLESYKVMIAQYTERVPILKDDLDFILWQYTGKGHLNGINGYVDKSMFMGEHKLREIRFRHK
ncbi:MAG: glycoside hydrolase family 25 protein [Prevotella sp.]|jgi:lysozyme